MRPIRLDLKGFTAFREEQVVDFSPLELFAISGPTGAGKSSILDAITYALYGKVERVGNECGQLISQGLPAMAVTFEFGCGAERYRVTRRTSRMAPTKVMLERFDGADWVAEAGQVRDVGAKIETIVGLGYDGFTRAVLLPQGKFDQFLGGDANVRRRLLTDLLGLELFERMSKMANARFADAAATRRTKQEFLVTTYAHVTDEAIAAQREAAEEARERERRIGAARKRVGEIVKRADALRSSADQFGALAREADGIARACTAHSERLRSLGRDADNAETLWKERGAAAATAKKAEERARSEHDRTAAKLGKAADMVAARGKAEQLEALRAHAGDARVALEKAEGAEPARRADSVRMQAEAKAAEMSEARAKAAVEEARASLDALRHDEALAAVAHGLRKGDPCPVCGGLLRKLPQAPAAASLRTAVGTVRSAEKDLEAARRNSANLALKAAAAANAATQALQEVKRTRDEIGREETHATALERDLSTVLGPRLPADIAAVLTGRIDRLAALNGEADAARDTRFAADASAAEAKFSLEQVRGSVATQVAAIPVAQTAGLLERTAQAVPDAKLPPFALDLDVAEGATRLAERAAAVGAGLVKIAAELRRLAEERLASEPEMLRDALDATDGLVPAMSSLDALANAIELAARTATSDVATSETRAKDLADALARKQALGDEIALLGRRADALRAIGRDLQQNAIVAFLQAQALRGLAREGGARLRELSDNRYELRHERDEFYVADLWNGEEQRSVKTLSGGETFLASLALALSLSGQISALSSGARASLDSLFLDEGFGSLDSEAVDLVIRGLERLRSDGRMIGVITHVREITDRLPRIEVHKTLTGSRLEVVP
ncbi:MAG: AAA family ATPase [Candidatus Limnocylindria bacterium]